MQEWEKAIDIFVKDWKNRPEVLGALVCGSYVTGNAGPNSDIDVHIVLKDSELWQERGNKRINGFLFEYFANPPSKIKEYFESDYQNRRQCTCVQFASGRILFDTDDTIKHLVDISKEFIKRPMPPLSEDDIEQMKYSLWDGLDSLNESLILKKDDFNMIYYNFLHMIFDKYNTFKLMPHLHVHRVAESLTNPADKQRYFRKAFPDEKFSSLYVNALKSDTPSTMFQRIEILLKHVFKAMGGFEIDGWKLHLALKENK